MVAEGDQRLVAAAVVPTEVRGVDTRRKALVEDGLHVLRHIFVLGVRLALALLEEVRGRHLLRVANHDELLRARDDADCVPDGNLRRLVEHDEVERCRVRRQVLRHGERAHEEARLEDGGERRNLREQLAHGLLPSLLLALAAEDAELACCGTILRAAARETCGEAREHLALRLFARLLVKCAEAHNAFLL